MSTKIYLIRHGQSVANNLGIFLGQVDMELTETGKKQAELTADFFEVAGIRPDKIYASDLIRAYDTAQASARRFALPIIKDTDLREISAGFWEKVPFDDLPRLFPDSYGTWLRDIGNACCDGGESVMQVQKRIVSAVKRIAEDNDGRTVFIFTHATPVRLFAAYCKGMDSDGVKELPWPTNASVTEASYENGCFRLKEYSRDDFMGNCVTKLPANV